MYDRLAAGGGGDPELHDAGRQPYCACFQLPFNLLEAAACRDRGEELTMSGPKVGKPAGAKAKAPDAKKAPLSDEERDSQLRELAAREAELAAAKDRLDRCYSASR